MDSLKQKWKLMHPQCQPTHGLCTAFPFSPRRTGYLSKIKQHGLKSERERAVTTDLAASRQCQHRGKPDYGCAQGGQHGRSLDFLIKLFIQLPMCTTNQCMLLT